MKKISLLGATGSIGLQTIDIIASNKEKFQLIAFSSGRNIEKTREIIQLTDPELVSVQEEPLTASSAAGQFKLCITGTFHGFFLLVPVFPVPVP